MTDSAAPGLGERPSPAAALERRFTHILHHAMQGVPLVNPALDVRAVGFRPWQHHWLGVLVTPWFMNLVLMPRVAAQWQPVPERDSRSFVFPAGVFEFIGADDPEIGPHLACSLFSPMFEFATPEAAHDTAQAALDALFDAANRPAADPAGDAAPEPAQELPSRPAEPAVVVSKRGFLFGRPPRAADAKA